MAEKERITNPSMGSNELGTETNEEVPTGVSTGTDTQLHITALGGNKHKKFDNKEKASEESEFLDRGNSDE
ncbi:MAG: hypothetical protein Q8891_11200 [Bacteroidota bacterium]|nr:hypothetical protein [Bacteroidota bacterium]